MSIEGIRLKQWLHLDRCSHCCCLSRGNPARQRVGLLLLQFLDADIAELYM